MHGLAIVAFAALATAVPLEKRFGDFDLVKVDTRADEQNLFVCPGDAPYGGCALNGNPYYVNEAQTGSVIADLGGVWECPTKYGLSNITALCCNALSHDGDYDYSTWCTNSRTTYLSTQILNELTASNEHKPSQAGGNPPEGSDKLKAELEEVTAKLQLEDFEQKLEDALKKLDLEAAEAELKAATEKFDLDSLKQELEAATQKVDLSKLEAVTSKLHQ